MGKQTKIAFDEYFTEIFPKTLPSFLRIL